MWTRWNDFGLGGWEQTFAAFNDLRREMDRVFSDFERGYGAGRSRPVLTARARQDWPRVALQDAGSELHLRAEVPGLGEKDLEITVENNSLTLRGQRAVDTPEGYSVHRQERSPLAFSRSFTLPCRVDAEKVTANLRHGILSMTLPKVAEEQPRQIQVSVS